MVLSGTSSQLGQFVPDCKEEIPAKEVEGNQQGTLEKCTSFIVPVSSTEGLEMVRVALQGDL